MPGRSGRREPYDDPYTYNDPYRNEPPNLGQNVGYEYVGTDEATQHDSSPPPRYRSRGNRDPSPSQRDRARERDRGAGSSPTRHKSTKGKVPPPPTDAELNARKRDKFNNWNDYQAKYQDWAQRPNVQANMQRGKSYGKKGLEFMGSAAAAYLASQQGGGGHGSARSRSVDRDYHSSGKERGGGSGRYYQSDREGDRRRHRREPSYSPSPPRHRSTKHRDDDADVRSKNRRQNSYSPSPPRRRRDHDDRDDRDKGGRHSHRDEDDRRRHRRNHSYSRSPSPSGRHRDKDSRGRPLGRSNTTGGGFRRSFSESMKPPTDRNAAARWQMAARAALEAGGVAAFRLRKEPGGWAGPKGAKVATAALGAAAIDAFVDKDPRRERGNGMKGMAENVIGGLIASKVTGVKRAKSGRRR